MVGGGVIVKGERMREICVLMEPGCILVSVVVTPIYPCEATAENCTQVKLLVLIQYYNYGRQTP